MIPISVYKFMEVAFAATTILEKIGITLTTRYISC